MQKLINVIQNFFGSSHQYDPLEYGDIEANYDYARHNETSEFQQYLKQFKENEEAFYTTIYECARECKYRTIPDDNSAPLVMQDFYYQMIDANLSDESPYAKYGVTWMVEHHLICQLIAIFYRIAPSKKEQCRWTPLLCRHTDIGTLVAYTSIQIENCIMHIIDKCVEYNLNVEEYILSEDEEEQEKKEKPIIENGIEGKQELIHHDNNHTAIIINNG